MNRVQVELRGFQQETRYYEEHYEELLAEYPEQWVAIFNQKVVGASPDYDQLLADLEGAGVPIDRTLFKFLAREDELWILTA